MWLGAGLASGAVMAIGFYTGVRRLPRRHCRRADPCVTHQHGRVLVHLQAERLMVINPKPPRSAQLPCVERLTASRVFDSHGGSRGMSSYGTLTLPRCFVVPAIGDVLLRAADGETGMPNAQMAGGPLGTARDASGQNRRLAKREIIFLTPS